MIESVDDRLVVLVIDDDDDVRAFVKSRLERRNVTVIEASNGEVGLELFDDSIDVVVVDVGLPGIDGFTVVRRIRAIGDTPILIMTAAGDESDRVLGLEIGGDDYVVKPFLPGEFVSRVRALARRAKGHTGQSHNVVRFGVVEIEPDAKEVRRHGTRLPFTAKEFDLLWYLVSSPRQVFTRTQLLEAVWHAEPGWQSDSTVTEHIHRIRRHVETALNSPQHIVTVRNVGYRFDP